MENSVSDNNFIVSEEVIDSIKLEASDLSPQKDKEVKEISHLVGETFIKLYGKFIPPETRDRLNMLPHRIIVLPAEAYKKFRKEWEGERAPGRSFAPAYYATKGDAIIINEDYITNVSAITKVAGATDIDTYTWLIAHETAHFFQNNNLSHIFLELGASYYAQEIMKQLHRWIVIEKIDSGRSNLYKKLIQQVGDTVHKVAFGVNRSADDKYNIYGVMDESHQELLALFPKLKNPKE